MQNQSKKRGQSQRSQVNSHADGSRKKSTIPSAQRKKAMGTRQKSTAQQGRVSVSSSSRPKKVVTDQTQSKKQTNNGAKQPTSANGNGHKNAPVNRTPKHTNSSKRTLIGIVAIIIFAIVLFSGWRMFYTTNLKAVGTSTDDILVEIPEESSVSDVAQILKDHDVIRNTMVFESYAGRHSRGSKQIQAANYMFNQSMDVPTIFNMMLDGDAYTGAVAITIPEGRRITEMAQILEDSHVCSADDFIAESNKLTEYKAKYPILSSIPDGTDRGLEGYLFADTYNWGSNVDASEVVTSMLDRFVDVYDESLQKETAEKGKTVDQIVIMASIVELETKLPEDKANAASVFYNRIAAGMPLQSDITVDYALGSKTAVLTEEQTQTPSPYNTYINQGLPIGPICSPSISSIEAALNPASTKYLFFVADMDSGKLHFNETLEGHNADVQTYMGD